MTVTATAEATRRCSRCGQELPLTAYHSNGRGGVRKACRECNTAINREWRERVMGETVAGMRRCRGCGNLLPLAAFSADHRGRDHVSCDACLEKQRARLRPDAPRRVFGPVREAEPEPEPIRVIRLKRRIVSRCERCGSGFLEIDEDGDLHCLCGWFPRRYRPA